MTEVNRENIYQKTDGENIQARKFYECPINSTHNTLIRHRNLFLESIIKEVNCRVAEIVISTIKYPVFIEVDMRVRPEGDFAMSNECKANPLACKIGHGFTGSSNLLDFLKIVTTIYNQCYTKLDESGQKPYPLIIGFDVPENCSNTIYSEINKILECGKKMGGN